MGCCIGRQDTTGARQSQIIDHDGWLGNLLLPLSCGRGRGRGADFYTGRPVIKVMRG